ncbi:hypothetical protein [Ralstonia phage RP13]|nr:hypothetical protein [Ralstonia phage RP13]
MSLTADISTSILGLNSTIKSQVLSNLASQLSPSDLASVTALLTDAFTPATNATIAPSLDTHQATLDSKVNQGAQAAAEVQKDADTVASAPSSPIVQDGISSLKKAEMPVVSKRFTSVSPMPVASNALSEDYPNTRGQTDDAQNWFKINKTTGYTEFVHNSGCSLKIDKSGNVSIHIVGDLKWIVQNDMLLNVLKNADLHAIGNLSVEGASTYLGY